MTIEQQDTATSATSATNDATEAIREFLRLEPREVPLGGPRAMTVFRTLPARETSLIGAWCFADQFGPDDVTESGGMRVPRHPHTGLATVSWLFQGAITHRDSLGYHALVRPGDLDVMVGGRGITHSEFSTNDTTVLHGVQLWYALPDRARFRERDFFVHTPVERRTDRAALRVGFGAVSGVDDRGVRLGDASPAPSDTALDLAQIDLVAGASLTLELDPTHEYGVIVDLGHPRLEASGQWATGNPHENLLLPDGSDELRLTAEDEDVRVMLLGGEPLGEDIVMWWNFIGRSNEEIVAFRERYQAEIGASGDGDDEERGGQEQDSRRAGDVELHPRVREAGVAQHGEQFGPWPLATPEALPAPALPNGRMKSRGRRRKDW